MFSLKFEKEEHFLSVPHSIFEYPPPSPAGGYPFNFSMLYSSSSTGGRGCFGGIKGIGVVSLAFIISLMKLGSFV